jgi:hypothetical protein
MVPFQSGALEARRRNFDRRMTGAAAFGERSTRLRRTASECGAESGRILSSRPKEILHWRRNTFSIEASLAARMSRRPTSTEPWECSPKAFGSGRCARLDLPATDLREPGFHTVCSNPRAHRYARSLGSLEERRTPQVGHWPGPSRFGISLTCLIGRRGGMSLSLTYDRQSHLSLTFREK